VLNDVSVGNANGSPDGVGAVAPALAAQTEPMALRKKGDAKIKAKLSMPRSRNPGA
jgi:hypothetical protein